GTAVKALTGKKMHVLLDKLAERAAFERTGTRLYDMMLQKVMAAPSLPAGMTIEGVQQIRDDEHSHFLLLTTAIQELGADPTAMTPCADVTGVQGMGLVQAMGEPRLTIAQALSTLLAAEVIDKASWELLIELAEQFGLDELVQKFSDALVAEQREEAMTRTWMSPPLPDEAAIGEQLPVCAARLGQPAGPLVTTHASSAVSLRPGCSQCASVFVHLLTDPPGSPVRNADPA